jgi:RNA polymerase sigma-70 factor (ECF subfamily)
MKIRRAPRRRATAASGKVAGRPFTSQGITGRDARYSSNKLADRATEEIRDRMVEFLPRLRRFARSLARDLDQSEDLLQETCARALTNLDQWTPGTRLDSWMFRIAQNLWFDRTRAEKVRGEVIDIDSIGDLSSGDGRVVTESRLTLQDVRRGMVQLSADQQVLIALVCVDGLSYQEAADILNLPPGTVMSRLARARIALSEAIYGQTEAGRRSH